MLNGAMGRRMTAIFGLLLASACGSEDDGGGGSGNGSLAAPLLEMVMPMAPGGLHVTWKNAQADCEEVEAERKDATTDYAVVFSVPGSVDNKHDGTATDKVEYTYRLRCKKSDSYSPYSNEMSGTP